MNDAASTYALTVDGVGEFVFSKRNMRKMIAIGVETSRLTEGVEVEPFLALFIEALATVKTLTVEAPDGWDPNESDPFDSDSYDRVMKVWGALRDKETSFRAGSKGQSAGTGTASIGDTGVLVSPKIQPAAD